MINSTGNYLDRTPPHSIEAEKAVLGAMLLDGSCISGVAAIIPNASAFYDPTNRAIYATIIRLAGESGAVDPLLVGQALLDAGAIADVGGGTYLSELVGVVPTAVHADHYARIVADKCLLRRMAAVAADTLYRVYAPGATPDTISPEVARLNPTKFKAGITIAGSFRPFPIDVLPEPIRSFVTDAAGAIGCDPSYIALPMLSGLGAAIGNTHRIALKRGWSEPAIIWTAVVGESGTAKSPALELPLRSVRKRQHEAMKLHAAALKRHTDAVSKLARDEVKPEAPIATRCWTDDATTEALAVLMQQNPRGLLMVRDELSGWFSFDRYAGGKGGGDAARWLEMFGGRPMVVDRKGGGTLYVPHAAVSIAGGIQPTTLRRALGQEHRDNGLAARLLLAWPPRIPKRWTEADVDPEAEAAVASVFDGLFVLTPETDEDGDERPRLLPLAGDGKAAWVRFYNEHASEQADLSGDLSAAWSKLEGYAARLALVIQLARWAAGDATLADATRVDAVSISAGVTLARWFGNEARRVYAMLGESDEDLATRRLVEWIERKGGTVTVRDLTRGPREYRDADKAAKALAGLVREGRGRWEVDNHGGGPGRSVDRFRLLLPAGDTGDGDTNGEIAGPCADSVTVTKPADTDDGWGVR